MFTQELEGIGLFQGLAPTQLAILSGILFEKQFQKDDILFKQGDLASILYVVRRGKIIIHHKPYDGEELFVAAIEPDGVFGWSAALGHPRYTSSAVAVDDGTALAIHGAKLRCLCLQQPEAEVLILERLAGMVAERRQTMQQQVVRLLRSEIEYNEHCMERKMQHG